MAWRIGVDSGGTVIDLCLFNDASGRVEVWKVSSTPDDRSRGIAGYFGHGTTVGTNALIQHRAACIRIGQVPTP